MDMSQFASTSGFLKAADIKANGGPLRLKIVDIRDGQFGKPDLHFENGAKLGLNATNGRTLLNAYGADSNDWLDKVIELSVGTIQYQGENKEVILAKPISPATRKMQPKPGATIVRDLDDEIPF